MARRKQQRRERRKSAITIIPPDRPGRPWRVVVSTRFGEYATIEVATAAEANRVRLELPVRGWQTQVVGGRLLRDETSAPPKAHKKPVQWPRRVDRPEV